MQNDCNSQTATFLSRNFSMYQSKIISDYMQAMVPIVYNNFRIMFLKMMNIYIYNSQIKKMHGFLIFIGEVVRMKFMKMSRAFVEK